MTWYERSIMNILPLNHDHWDRDRALKTRPFYLAPLKIGASTMCGLDTCCSFLADFFRSEQWYIFCCPLVFRDAFRRNDGQSVQCADSFIDWKPHFTYNYKQAKPFRPLNCKKASLFHHLKQRTILLFWTSLTATTEYCQYCRSIFLWEIWSHKKIPRKTKHLPMKLFLWKLFSIRQNLNVLEKVAK